MRERLRSLVWIRGRLHFVADDGVAPMLDLVAAATSNLALLQVNSPSDDGTALSLLRLEAASVVVADASGAEAVGVAALLAARPDPFWAMESCWLQHLEVDHRDVVDLLASRLPAAMRRGQVRLLGLDRYGLRLRIEAPDGDHDVRLPFTTPVTDVRGLSRAIRTLVGCPFLNGLRMRRI
jgi:hypothetical protein